MSARSTSGGCARTAAGCSCRRDASAGHPDGSYGGGRYLLDTIKGADLGRGFVPDTIVLDFNFAYNPSCAYDPAWACPLAPVGNTVSVAIPVGEHYSGRGGHRSATPLQRQ